MFTPLVANKYVDRYLANQDAWLKLLIFLSGGLYLIGFLMKENITYKKNKIHLPLVLLILIVIFSFIKNGFLISSLNAIILNRICVSPATKMQGFDLSDPCTIG